MQDICDVLEYEQEVRLSSFSDAANFQSEESEESDDLPPEADADKLAGLLRQPEKEDFFAAASPAAEDAGHDFPPAAASPVPKVSFRPMVSMESANDSDGGKQRVLAASDLAPDLVPDLVQQGESLFQHLGRTLSELQRLLDDELLLDLARSAGSLKLFCVAISATIEALPHDKGFGCLPPANSLPEPAPNDAYLCHGGRRDRTDDAAELDCALKAADAGSARVQAVPASTAKRVSPHLMRGKVAKSGSLSEHL